MKTIVAFDFDGTITSKDTLLEFIQFSRGKRHFYFGFFLFLPLLLGMKLKLIPNWKVKQRLFSYFFKDIHLEKFNKWGEEFVQIIEKCIRREAFDTLMYHKKKGDTLLIISASIENWIEPWAKKHDIEFVLATKLKISNDNYITGFFDSRNCYGQEKVNRLLELFPKRHEYSLIAYGDSAGDHELLKFADKSYYKPFRDN